MVKNTTIHMWHPARVALMQEIRKHPDLHAQLLRTYGPPTEENFTDYIAAISSYCDIEVDGFYTLDQLNKMCAILYTDLTKKRKIVLH